MARETDKVSISIEIRKIGEGLEQVKREMSALTNQVKTEGAKITNEASRISSSFQSIKRLIPAGFAGLIGIAGITRLVKGIFDTGVAFETLEFQLRAVSKTAEEAESQFKMIREFAAKTPFMTQNVTEAFIMLKAVGLAPTRKEMEIFGNTAFAMGRDITDVAQSIIALETEVLRRLGIQLDRTGKKAIVISGDMRIEVENSIDAIRTAVIDMWEKRFPGAMKEAEKSWKGLAALLGSEWDELKALLAETVLPTVKDIVKALVGATQAVRGYFAAWREGTRENLERRLEEAKQRVTEIRKEMETLIDTDKAAWHWALALEEITKDKDKAQEEYNKKLTKAIAIVNNLQAQLDILNEKEKENIEAKKRGGTLSKEAIETNKRLKDEITKLTKTELEQLEIWRQKTLAIEGVNKAYVNMIYNIKKEAIERRAAAEAAKKLPELSVAERIAAIRKELRERVEKEERELLETQIRLGKELVQSEHLTEAEREAIWAEYRDVRIKQINEEMAAMELAGVSSEMIVAYQKDALAELEQAHKKTTSEIGHVWEDLRSDLQWSLEAGFFDLFKGGIDDIGDFFKQFCNMLYESFARTVAKMITEWLIFEGITGIVSGISGWFGGGGAPKTYVAQHGLMITEPILGAGLKTGSRYLFGEAGPEAVVPARGFSTTRELQQNIFIVDDREKIKGMTPNDTLIVVSEDIQKDGIIRKTIKRFI